MSEPTVWERVRKVIQEVADSNTGAMYDMPWWWSEKITELLDAAEEKLLNASDPGPIVQHQPSSSQVERDSLRAELAALRQKIADDILALGRRNCIAKGDHTRRSAYAEAARLALTSGLAPTGQETERPS